MMDVDVVPLLPEVPGIDLGEYTGTLLERFSNPSISDDLGRLCRRGSTKVPNYLLPSVSEAIAQGRPHLLLTLAVAGWLRYLRGHDYAGEPIELQDAKAHILQPKAAEAGSDPRPLLQERSVFGDLGNDEKFIESVEAALEALEEGPREAMEAYLRMDTEEVAA
jgi:mannitol 2-dehydrogenase